MQGVIIAPIWVGELLSKRSIVTFSQASQKRSTVITLIPQVIGFLAYHVTTATYSYRTVSDFCSYLCMYIWHAKRVTMWMSMLSHYETVISIVRKHDSNLVALTLTLTHRTEACFYKIEARMHIHAVTLLVCQDLHHIV